MKIGFIVDPLPDLKPYKDSSVAMMRAAAKRGHDVFVILRQDLRLRDDTVSARATPITVFAEDEPWYQTHDPVDFALNQFDAVLMRQDPPFDAEYVAATWILERAVAQGARVFNDPRAIRDHSEKIAIAEFPQLAPTSLVSRNALDLNQFIDEFGDVILKPLDGMGGRGVFRVQANDPNRHVIIETLAENGAKSVMAQRFIPEIFQHGDKRILILAGQVIPYSLARIPKAGETRGNLAVGGRGVVMPLTAREQEIADTVARVLWPRGLLIIGIDVIGDFLTEINVTSPTCMVEIAGESGIDVAGVVIDALSGFENVKQI